MSGIDQATRAARVSVQTLPDDTLALSALTGKEQLSELFEYKVECVSEDPAIDLYDVLGNSMSIEIDAQADTKRYVHGLVSHAAHAGSRGEYALYQLTLTAWPWMLTQTSDCRIYTDMNVPDIISTVLSDNGFDDFDNRLMGSYDQWHFCVQYQETDFDFISRLMEHEGIYYYFEHMDHKHVMVLCDGASAHKSVPEYGQIPYYPAGSNENRDVDHLSNWQFEKKIRSAKYVTKDFGFDEPKRDLLVQSTDTNEGSYAAKEIFHFPGGYSNSDSGELTRSYGEKLARARMEALTAGHEMAHAVGDVRGLNAGNLFTLYNCERDDQNREYLIVCSTLSIKMDSFYSGDGGGSVELKSTFKSMPSKIQFRPQRKTRKPEIRGPQTAIVVGPKGEEIWTDKHGRVKLQFHWDRYGESDENSSCWIRVSQAWAGEKWGSIHIPRMGQEVIVEYIDGDPDRPIVTGRVYNGDRPVPYDLPANATQSGIKSRSSKGGKPVNFNEIRMEDKKGSEELYIHAEKDQNNIVENDETTNVGNNRSEDVGNDEIINIGSNRTETVGKDEKISIGSNRKLSVGKDESISIGSDRKTEIGSNDTLQVGKKILINAGDEIVIKTGKSSITMKKDGSIVISGKDISLKASGAINGKASKNIVLKGKKILQN